MPRVGETKPGVPNRVAKVRHVKSQGQVRSHTCHWPGCGRQCPPAKWGCYKCWLRLPKYLRDKIWAAYRVGQELTLTPSREYVAVAEEVEQWIHNNYPDTRGKGH